MDGVVSPQRIVDGARAMADFDVLCLQEIAQGYPGMPGAPGDQPAQLAALLPGYQLFSVRRWTSSVPTARGSASAT